MCLEELSLQKVSCFLFFHILDKGLSKNGLYFFHFCARIVANTQFKGFIALKIDIIFVKLMLSSRKGFISMI